ncbi:MAG: DUF934 domain-containing protein [Methylovulum sp.]
MQIIKDKQIIDDNWQSLTDDAELGTGDISVSLSRWRQEKQQLLNRNGKLGIRINPADSVADFADDLDKVQLIELDFPEFADGRLFTHAWLLRRRYNFHGEIRATGHYMPDQVFYLSRVGVDAFKPEKAEQLATVLANLNDFTVNYQSSII